ncbi:MAG TPA: Ig-like domain-containing protein [Gemmatimonadaceae bacterium]|nr:Ig-like domain-containing protein [Gemmatimonadaceae bacterium]
MRFRPAVLAGRAAVLVILAACGGDSSGPDTPTPASITIQPGAGALDAIGATAQLTATVKDQHGQPIAGATVTWHSGSESIATVNGSGLVTAVANGSADITASVGSVQGHLMVTVAQGVRAMVKPFGDAQAGVAGQPLSAPLVVQVNDRLGHGVAGVAVSFGADAGDGSMSPATAMTAANGQAQTTWTLGGTAGAQRASAVVAGLDSVHFTATAVDPADAPAITAIAPDTLVEGQSFTITGRNFSATPSGNVVKVDGDPATVTAATPTSLTVVVPSSVCKPVRLATVSVQAGVVTATSAAVPVRPAAFTTLAVGQELVVQDPTKFCLQFAPAAGGSDMYVMGLSAPAELPGAVLPFRVQARGGASAGAMMGPQLPVPPIASAMPRVAPSMRGGSGASLRASRELLRGRARAEAKLRGWEARTLPTLAAHRRRRGALSASVAPLATTGTPAMGDTLTLRVPNLAASNLCSSYTTIRAVVRVIGSAGIWVQDVANPTTDALTLADMQAASDEFDTNVYATDVAYFGQPSDIDGNGRVIVVLTWQVNKSKGILGFVFSGDLFPGDPSCPQSNGGELYYGQVPDPANVAGTGARSKADVLQQMPELIAHEFSHIIQTSQRVILHDGTFMEGWEMEGQATFAEELVGQAVLGNTSGQNYGASVGFGTGYDWYADPLVKWMEYFGDLGQNQQAANAPDLCTVYGNLDLTNLPCDVSAFYGASWILQRYIGDQYGPTYPGGLQQLTRDWVAKNPTLSGTQNIGALLGVDYDQLFVRFATALALDDQVNISGSASWVPSQFSITSWNSSNLASYVSTCCGFGWLAPPGMGFADDSASRSVRGGSTAYTVLSASGAHPAAAIQVTTPGGAPLGTTLRPALWIVRVQ